MIGAAKGVAQSRNGTNSARIPKKCSRVRTRYFTELLGYTRLSQQRELDELRQTVQGLRASMKGG